MDVHKDSITVAIILAAGRVPNCAQRSQTEARDLVSKLCHPSFKAPTMHRALVALALTVTVASALTAQRSPDFAEVRRILREGMVKEGAPAAAFAVVRYGTIIWE